MKLADKFGCTHLRGRTELGPYWLSRNTLEEIRALDNERSLERINTNNYVWYLTPLQCEPVMKLKGTKKGLTAMIVGKGPGLDELTIDMIGEADVILATNDSVHHVVDIVGDSGVPVYNIQCDHLAGNCQNDNSIPIILSNCALYYGDAKEVYIARVSDFSDDNWHPVGCTAIHIAKIMGCERLIFVGFDGAFKGKMGYAKTIGKSPIKGRYTNPNRFASHGKPMKEVIGDMSYTVLSPGDSDHDTSTSCKPEQSQDNQQEQSEHAHVESQVQKQDTID